MGEYKPKPIKGLKVKVNGIVYDKIAYMSCSSEGIYIENIDSQTTTTNIRCKAEDLEIIVNQDTN